jgi:large subunit ribosomal protein L35
MFIVSLPLLKIKEMPKTKTNSSAKKRFSLTGTGKIKRKHAYKRHILTKKKKDRKRGLRNSGLVSKGDTNNVKALLAL